MRKPHANSVLKTLPDETQDRIAGWCAEDTLSSAVSRCSAELQLKTSVSSMGDFFAWWKLKQKFAAADSASKAAEELLAKIDPAASAEKLQAFGQLMFLEKAIAADKNEDFVSLSMAGVRSRELTAKIAGDRLKYEQKERELKLAQAKYRRETCKLFLEWHDKEQAKQIATGGGTNAEKIEALGRAMFGADWDE